MTLPWRTRTKPQGADQRSVEALVTRFGPTVYRRAQMLLCNTEDARDAMQEVFITIMRCQTELDHEAASWIYRVTTNTCLNRLRARKRQQALVRSAGEFARDTTESDAEVKYLVHALIANSEPECAAAAVYVHLEGMSHAEAAQLLGVSRRTVGNLLERFQEWAQYALADLLPRDALRPDDLTLTHGES